MNDLNIRIMKKYLTIVMIILSSVVIGINLILSYIAIGNAFNLHKNNSKVELEIFSEEVENRTASARKLGTQIYQDPDIEIAFTQRDFDSEKFEERMKFYAISDYYIKSLHLYSSYTDMWYSVENASLRALNPGTEQIFGNMSEVISKQKDNRDGFLSEENGVPVYTFIIYPFTRSENAIVINYNINYFDIHSKKTKCAYMVFGNRGQLVIKDSNYGTQKDNELCAYLVNNLDKEENVWFNGEHVIVRMRKSGRNYFSITNISDFLNKTTPTVASAIIGSIIMIILVIFCFTSAMTWMLKKFGQYYWYAESVRNEIKEKNDIAELKSYIRGDGSINISGVSTKVDKKKSCVLFRLYIRDLEKNNTSEGARDKMALNYAVRNVFLELLGDADVDVVKMSSEDIVILCNTDTAELAYETIIKTRTVIEDVLNMKMTIVKHRNSVDFSDVPSMFEKLVSAGDKSFFVGDDAVIDASDYDNPDVAVDSAMLIDKIERTVSLGNAMEARDMLRSEEIMYMSVYDAKGIAVTVVKKLRMRSAVMSEQKHKVIEGISEDIIEYINGECNWDGIVERMGDLFENMVNLSKYNSEEYSKEKYEQIITMIHEHYCDDGFCRDTVAEEIKMSIKSMEQIFKRRENKSITNYIFEYRMAKAKELLDGSDLSIKEVAEKVGYSNVSHFIQNFKKTYSITPDKYRKNR